MIPALVYGLWPRSDAFELRFAVFAGLGLTGSALLVYGGMDPLRYPLPGVVCFAFVGMRMLDAIVEWAARRFGAKWSPIGSWLARTMPLLLVLSVFFLGSLPESAEWIRRYCASYRQVGTLHPANVAVNSAQAEWGERRDGSADTSIRTRSSQRRIPGPLRCIAVTRRTGFPTI